MVSNLLAQKKEIKRLEKEEQRRRKEDEELGRERNEEERERAVRDFEDTMMGLEGKGKKGGHGDGVLEGRGIKRRFELDEEEMRRGVVEERKKARTALEDEKVGI